MATRSFIGIKNEDGTVESIYCHWDGYIEHHGPILRDHYSDEAIVRKMISLGDMSELEARLEPAEGEDHSFENSVDGVCVFYGRDRGEDDVDSRKYDSEEEWLEKNDEILYLFKDGEWWHRQGASGDLERLGK